MNFEVIATPRFRRELKYLCKKFPSLKFEYLSLVEQLSVEPFLGVRLGNDSYKIRLSIESKGNGKSGSARVITYVVVSDQAVFLLSIFDKGEQENILDGEILRLLKNLK